MRRKIVGVVTAAFALTAMWVAVYLFGNPGGLSNVETVGVSGLAILGASFLLAWGAETAEKDVPRGFAIAVLAILAVAPEYAVDALYAFDAGTGSATAETCGRLSAAAIENGETALAGACHDANLAIANMTGANRILIGLGWSGIALFTVLRNGSSSDPAVRNRSGVFSDAVMLDRDVGLDIVFLFAATLWAFFVPLGGGIDALDTFVLVGLYVGYIVIVLNGDVDTTEEHVGVPAYLQTFAKPYRVATVVGLFLYAGLMIFTAVEPFAHGLEQLGRDVGVPAFFMIQWIAPLASESPELVVVAVLVNKARSTAGFNALVSSKLNQWTLLIGTLVLVYSIGLGRYGALPFDQKQAAEIWLTAAQSFFALSILVNFRISVREALTLLTLFVTQVLLEFLIIREVVPLAVTSYDLLLAFTAIYLVLGVGLFYSRRRALRRIVDDALDTTREALFQRDDRGQTAD